MGPQLRSILPATNHQLKPTTINPADIVSRRRQLQTTQKWYYDQTAHPLPPLKTGGKIYAQLSKGDDWRPAKVIAPSSQLSPTPYRRQMVTPSAATVASYGAETAPEAIPPEATEHTSPPEVYTTRSGCVVKCPNEMNL